MAKIYLAIPYTGDETNSFLLACEIAGELMKLGHVVFSPISHSHPIARHCDLPGDYNFWQRCNDSWIEWCDKVLVARLVGWKTSKGIKDEIRRALELGKDVGVVQQSIIDHLIERRKARCTSSINSESLPMSQVESKQN